MILFHQSSLSLCHGQPASTICSFGCISFFPVVHYWPSPPDLPFGVIDGSGQNYGTAWPVIIPQQWNIHGPPHRSACWLWRRGSWWLWRSLIDGMARWWMRTDCSVTLLYWQNTLRWWQHRMAMVWWDGGRGGRSGGGLLFLVSVYNVLFQHGLSSLTASETFKSLGIVIWLNCWPEDPKHTLLLVQCVP